MKTIGVLLALAVLCGASGAWAQPANEAALKREVERRFEVLPLRDGVALQPRSAIGVRSIEIAGGTIAIDGQPATGAELRSRLGDAADVVLQLSYLSDTARRELFAPTRGASPSASPSAPPVPDTAPSPSAPAEPAQPTPSIMPPEPPAPPAPARRTRNDRRRNGDQVRFGRDIMVAEDEVVEGDGVAVGGSVTLGPRSRVERDVTVVGGQLHRDPGAVVGERAQEVSIPGLEMERWDWDRNPVRLWGRSMLGSAFAFVGTLARVAVLCLLAALVVLFGREYAERAGTTAATESLKAGAVGFIAQILFLPLLIVTIVVLVITIIGIPLLLLLPFALLALAVVALIGFTGIAQRVGAFAAGRFGWNDQNPYALTIIGVLLLMLPVLLSRLVSLGGGFMFPLAIALGIAGFVIEYVAWTVGFGAVALMRFRRGRSSSGGEVAVG
jgi:hypothetical protein